MKCMCTQVDHYGISSSNICMLNMVLITICLKIKQNNSFLKQVYLKGIVNYNAGLCILVNPISLMVSSCLISIYLCMI